MSKSGVLARVGTALRSLGIRPPWAVSSAGRTGRGQGQGVALHLAGRGVPSCSARAAARGPGLTLLGQRVGRVPSVITGAGRGATQQQGLHSSRDRFAHMCCAAARPQYTGPVSSPEYMSHLPTSLEYRKNSPA